MARYLVGVYTVTAGLQEESLGSDEQEIVLFSWVVVDLTNTKVRNQFHYHLTQIHWTLIIIAFSRIKIADNLESNIDFQTTYQLQLINYVIWKV